MDRSLLFFKRLKNSRDGRRLFANFGYLSLLELTTHLFPLITTPYLARVIGVEGFGILAIGTAVVAYFQTITNYGFDYTSVREIARNRDDRELVSKIVSDTLASKFVLMIISLLLLTILIICVPFIRENSIVILCTFSIVPGSVFFANWFFQAMEDMKYITIMNIVSRLIFTVFVFVFIRKPEDYLLQPILLGIGNFIPAMIAIYIIRNKYNIHFIHVSWNTIGIKLKDGFNMFITLFLPSIYTNLNVLILGSYNGKTATGYYSGGTKFTSISYSLFQIISRTVYPFFSRRMDKHKLYVRLSFLMAIGISLLFFFFAEPIVMLFLGPEFEPTIKVLKIVAFTPIAVSLMNSYGFNYLVLKGKEKLMRNIIVVVTVFGLIIGCIGAIYYSYIGVAVASLSTQMLRAVLITICAKRVEKTERMGHGGQ